MNGWVRPVRTAWVVRDLVPGPDVDEFAEPDQVTAALTAPGAATGTLLAVQHPHRTPAARARGLSLTDALPIAREALDHLRANHYREIHDVVAPYRVDGPDGSAHGVLCLVDPAEVGRIRHTEEVFPDVVAERSAVLSGLGCATSAAMLVPVSGGAVLTSLLADVCEELADPAVSVVDSAGHRHRMWLLEKGSRQAELLELLQEQSLLVADGNHRVAAATGSSLLALITGGPSLRIGAIHRVLTGTGLDADTVYRRWREIGLTVTRGGDAEPPSRPGVVVALVDGEVLRVVLPDMGAETPQIDHGVVEQVLVKQALGIDPDGPSLRTLPAGRPVPAGADVLLQLAPVPFTDVLAVHAEGRRMPRKATYFTPKPRSGLLLAAL
ncbi:DUF1015 family protein [Kutzneria kofuensis]|uniref:DUF1015 family protein n=1 Tax=Kutzneria kofuensis TaxID=103725 RepID=UPI0016197C78|nr:DUF1015 family protein [Kutzneria kofuensis]